MLADIARLHTLRAASANEKTSQSTASAAVIHDLIHHYSTTTGADNVCKVRGALGIPNDGTANRVVAYPSVHPKLISLEIVFDGVRDKLQKIAKTKPKSNAGRMLRKAAASDFEVRHNLIHHSSCTHVPKEVPRIDGPCVGSSIWGVAKERRWNLGRRCSRR